ncbi:MAG: hypothetical protein GC155_05545 [Alphaproteobacteria bacterium]|nr:hypothetical protein [Alphaproteobacteria bacterium]
MPLIFPIAATARAALDEPEKAARTLAEARELAGAPVTLVSEWLRPAPAEHEEVQGKADVGVARGFVQLYEDAKGRPVIAVTFWKPQKPGKARTDAAAAKPKSAKRRAAVEDDTDDLYFAKPESRTRKRRRRTVDPHQLDLFKGPDQQGAESRDPHNPMVVIVEEEGDGAVFGLAEEARAARRKEKPAPARQRRKTGK